MNKILLLAICLLLLPSAAALDVGSPTGFVNDHAGILSPDERVQLESLLDFIEENSTIEIAVLTLPSLEGESLEMLANDVFSEWGIGKKDVDNGILILVAMEERSVRIEVGYGLEGEVTDAASRLIIENRIKPAFKEERYADGLTDAATDIWQLAVGDPDTVSEYSMGDNSYPRIFEWYAVILLILIYAAFAIVAAVKFKKDKKKQKKTKKTGALIVMLLAYLTHLVLGSTLVWFIMIVCFIILVSSGGGGFFFLPGFGGGRGGGGGFGGFGGGGSGGGGSSGGW